MDILSPKKIPSNLKLKNIVWLISGALKRYVGATAITADNLQYLRSRIDLLPVGEGHVGPKPDAAGNVGVLEATSATDTAWKINHGTADQELQYVCEYTIQK